MVKRSQAVLGREVETDRLLDGSIMAMADMRWEIGVSPEGNKAGESYIETPV